MQQTTGKNAWGVLPYPLHQAAHDPGEAWGDQAEVTCSCGARHPLHAGKCPGCRGKNPFHRLVTRRKRVEKWMDREIASAISPRVFDAQHVLEQARAFARTLDEVARRPFPEQRKDEELGRYTRRVSAHFPPLLKSLSPRQAAVRVTDEIKRSATGMARTAWDECERAATALTGRPVDRKQGNALKQQAELVATDLMNMTKPFLEALKTLQLTTSRLQTAYTAVKPILERDQSTGLGKKVWNKARSLMNPVGKHVRFPTAVWNNDREREELKRLDAVIGKLVDQAGRFKTEEKVLAERSDVMLNTYRLSMRRHLCRLLVDRYLHTDPAERAQLVRRVRSHKGVGNFLWRLLFGVRAGS